MKKPKILSQPQTFTPLGRPESDRKPLISQFEECAIEGMIQM